MIQMKAEWKEISNLIQNQAWTKILFYFFENDDKYNAAFKSLKLTYDDVIKSILKEIKNAKHPENKKMLLEEIVAFLIKNITLKKTTIIQSQLQLFLKILINNKDKNYCNFKIKMYENNPGINLELIRLMENVPEKATAQEVLIAHCKSAVLNKELIVYLLCNGAYFSGHMGKPVFLQIYEFLKLKKVEFIYGWSVATSYESRKWASSNKQDKEGFYFHQIKQFLQPFDKKKQTELHRWCASNSIIFTTFKESWQIEELLSHLAEFNNSEVHINSQDNNGNTALHVHLMGSNLNLKIVETLIENGASLDIENNDKQVPFQCLKNNDKVTVEFLQALLFHSIKLYQPKQIDLLIELAKEKNLDILNIRNKDGSAPLHHAWKKWSKKSSEKTFNLIKILLTAGADPDIIKKESTETTVYHRTSLLLLICEKKNHNSDEMNIIQLLLEKKANINASFKPLSYTSLFHACKRDNMPLVKFLLACNADPNIECYLHYNPLGSLYWNDREKKNSFQIAIQLLAHGAVFPFGKNPSEKLKETTVSELLFICHSLKETKKINDFTDLVQYIPLEIYESSVKKFMCEQFFSFADKPRQNIFSFFTCCKIKNFKLPKPLRLHIAAESLDIQDLPIKFKRELLLDFLMDVKLFPDPMKILMWLTDISTLEKSECKTNTLGL